MELAPLLCLYSRGAGEGHRTRVTEEYDPGLAQASGPRHLFLDPQGRCHPKASSQTLRPLGSHVGPQTCLVTLPRTCRLTLLVTLTGKMQLQALQLGQKLGPEQPLEAGMSRPYQEEERTGQHRDPS